MAEPQLSPSRSPMRSPLQTVMRSPLESRKVLTGTGTPPAGSSALLMETSGYILLEDGSKILLE